MSAELQERARAALRENKRRPNREGNRRYLLGGLVRCETCGYGCSGHATWGKGKRYSYYSCITNKPGKAVKTPPHRAPYVRAEWLEETLWADIKTFLENPGEVLERVRHQMGSEDDTGELEARRTDLEKRLAAKQAEKDRYIRLYAQEHISEAELDVYLADLKNQTENLRLLAESVEAALSQKREQRELAETTHAWLVTLRERLSEVEKDSEEAYRARRRLVELLVAGITVGRKEDGSPTIQVTYRFGPPEPGDRDEEEEMFIGAAQNAFRFWVPQQ